jgi:hypothetical protein
MSSRLSDPQRLVELVADQMFREVRLRNGRHWATDNVIAATGNGQPVRAAEAAGERPSPCDPPA